MKTLEVDGETYEIPTKQAQAMTNAIMYAWEKMGRPETPLSDSGEKVMNVIIATWEDTFPKEATAWYEERRLYKVNEKTIKEQVAQRTGRSLASYPGYIYQVMKRVFPTFRLGDRDNVIKFVKKYPMFLMANKV